MWDCAGYSGIKWDESFELQGFENFLRVNLAAFKFTHYFALHLVVTR